MSDETAAQVNHSIGTDGTLALNCVSGNVRIQGVDGEDARVVARWSRGAGDGDGGAPRLAVRRSNGALRVEPERIGRTFFGATFSFGSQGIDFEVEVPHGARIEINTVSADIDGHRLHGEQAYKTVSGDLKLRDAGERLSLRTVSGDAEIGADQPLELNATTTSGNVQLDGPRLQLVRVRTVSGDVRLRGRFASGPEHTLETVSGDLILEPDGGLTVEVKRALDVGGRGGRRLVVGDGSASLRFRSMSGDVRVKGSVTAAGSSENDDEETTDFPAQPAGAPAHTPAVAASEPDEAASIEILRALERGEIDVNEASRLLEGVTNRG